MASINRALREQNLLALYHKLVDLVPDISDQYSSWKIDNKYLELKVRGMHAFQLSLVSHAMRIIAADPFIGKELTVVDIGDSSGTHLKYLKGIYPDRSMRCLSINLDNEAVKKIRSKNLEAVCARAEELSSLSIKADIFLSFEMVEHLMNQCKFLHDLSEKTDCKLFVMTVPYVRNSRVGLYHVRNGVKRDVNPENTHVYELSPQDYRLLFQHCGWNIVAEKIYSQYPRRSIFGDLMKRYWRKYDFEGFYGIVLSRDKSWSALYNGWE